MEKLTFEQFVGVHLHKHRGIPFTIARLQELYNEYQREFIEEYEVDRKLWEAKGKPRRRRTKK